MGHCASRSTTESKHSKKLDDEIRRQRNHEMKKVKLLLLGPGESGKSTIFKQMKIIQLRGGFSEEEKRNFLSVIHSNCLTQMRVLLTGIQDNNVQLNDAAKEASQLVNCDVFNSESARWIKDLWNNEIVQRFYREKQKQLLLNDSAPYFFDQVDRIAQPNYVPSQDDILRARLRSTGIEEAEFKFEKLTFIMIDVGGQRSERRKWIHCFDSVNAILFVASLSCYDQFLREDVHQNSMIETLLLFQEVCQFDYFKSDIILFLNKSDLFEQKINQSPLSDIFPDYKGESDTEKALTFICRKFEALSTSKLYIHTTCALNTSNIRHVINDVQIVIMEKFLNELDVGSF